MTIREAREKWPDATGQTPWQDMWIWFCEKHGVVAFDVADEDQMMREHGPCWCFTQKPKSSPSAGGVP
jgi:hypothetical protein